MYYDHNIRYLDPQNNKNFEENNSCFYASGVDLDAFLTSFLRDKPQVITVADEVYHNYIDRLFNNGRAIDENGDLLNWLNTLHSRSNYIYAEEYICPPYVMANDLHIDHALIHKLSFLDRKNVLLVERSEIKFDPKDYENILGFNPNEESVSVENEVMGDSLYDINIPATTASDSDTDN